MLSERILSDDDKERNNSKHDLPRVRNYLRSGQPKKGLSLPQMHPLGLRELSRQPPSNLLRRSSESQD